MLIKNFVIKLKFFLLFHIDYKIFILDYRRSFFKNNIARSKLH